MAAMEKALRALATALDSITEPSALSRARAVGVTVSPWPEKPQTGTPSSSCSTAGAGTAFSGTLHANDGNDLLTITANESAGKAYAVNNGQVTGDMGDDTMTITASSDADSSYGVHATAQGTALASGGEGNDGFGGGGGGQADGGGGGDGDETEFVHGSFFRKGFV